MLRFICGALLTLLMGWLVDHLHSTAASDSLPLVAYG